MALIQCNFFSEVLGLSSQMTVILPQSSFNQQGDKRAYADKKYPTLYLLHGLSDDDTIWLRRTSIERYVSSMELAVVMPNVHRSFYTDMAYGGKYWTFVSEELPFIAQSMFPLSEKREDNFVAGLSMGGYGAFKMALSHPERFAAAASLSGALNIAKRELVTPDFHLIFGEDSLYGTDHDLLGLLSIVDQTTGSKPWLFQCCGTEDFLYKENLEFKQACERTGLELTYEQGPGDHEWGYWDAKIQEVLRWLPMDKRSAKG